MTGDTATWVVAALEVIGALGITVYWIAWWRESHDQPWLPAGYVQHEAPFVFSDMLLAVVLLAAATLQVIEHPAGPPLGLVAAGMLLFLGVLDFAYFAREGMFAREREGVVNTGVVAGVLGLALVLVVRFL